MTTTEANKTLQGTDSKEKNELLFSRFGINYNNLPPMFKKGSTLVRRDPKSVEGIAEVSTSEQANDGENQARRKVKKVRPYEGTTGEVTVLHEDIIGDGFWNQRPWLLR